MGVYKVIRSRGFTFIEMLVVLAIIAVLSMLALPSNGGRAVQLMIVETLELVEPYKQKISVSHALNGRFPADNKTVGMPEADKILGNYLAAAEVDDGAVHLRLGQKMPAALHGQLLSLRPVYVKDSLASPVSWVCGFDSVPEGMLAAGLNRTNVELKNLPLRCR
jgi:type IV pilus assembly protein PilA